MPNSTRKTPLLLRQGLMSGRVTAITRYTRKHVNGREVINAQIKHDVEDDFVALMLWRLYGEPERDCPDIVSILDGAADGETLNEDERRQLRAFHDRLRTLVEQENERLDAQKAALS